MRRAYYSRSINEFLIEEPDRILGELTRAHSFALEETQRNAWIVQTEILKRELEGCTGHIYYEFSIPRMGKRVDVLLVIHSAIILLEFKVGASEYHKLDQRQVIDYGLDLSNFHKGSHGRVVVPVLVATEAKSNFNREFVTNAMRLREPICINGSEISLLVDQIVGLDHAEYLDISSWEASGYMPTPTIIEATVALYRGHNVDEISRSDAGAININQTSKSISEIIEKARTRHEKAIVFITGVPGAGKTLVALNVATKYMDPDEELYSVFLSGNGPLVSILQEALARDKVKQEGMTITSARSEVKALIQNVHHFRDEGLTNPDAAPPEHVALFDEAQRAWNSHQTIKFMKAKKGIDDFELSEPEFLISCMDRHEDWAVVVCLVGGGQEINIGEAGIVGWYEALAHKFSHWNVYASKNLLESEYGGIEAAQRLNSISNKQYIDSLHLKTSMRSFRSENVSAFVKALLDLELDAARNIFSELQNVYPIVLTRSLDTGRNWLREKARGSERYGIVVSSQAERLRPEGIHVRAPCDPVKWFLNNEDDVRSSFYLEEVATEFQVQGLELDWACVAWDADFRYSENDWDHWSFKGSKWQKNRKIERQQYQKNAYRVLLTRARQGMIIVVPEGNQADATRPPEFYDSTYEYLTSIGISSI